MSTTAGLRGAALIDPRTNNTSIRFLRKQWWTSDRATYRANSPFTWGAQPANSLIFFNDINSGIWIVKLGKPKFQGSTTVPPLREQEADASPF